MFNQETDPDLEKVTFLKEAKPGAKFTFLHRQEAWSTADAAYLASKLEIPVHLFGHYLIVHQHLERSVVEGAFFEADTRQLLFSLVKITVPERSSGFPGKFVSYNPL